MDIDHQYYLDIKVVMKMKINRVKLFPNNNQKSKDIEEILKQELEENNFIVCEEDYDLAIAIGGDG